MDGAEARSFLDGAAPEPAAETLPAAVMGRPTTYSEDLALKICERIANGETVADICADEDMPHRASVFRWLNQHKEFAAFYAYAMEAMAEGDLDEIVKIADDSSGDITFGENAEGVPFATINKVKLARDDMRIKVRQWRLEKRLPRKYGVLVGQAPELMPPGSGSGDDARVINPAEPVVIENDPLYASFKAFEKVGKKA